ncbi:helix-turn-helix domain-containing protein [Chitinophaga sancti]|uniref:helix-turn-helix domain-containing protein n=1 Tax=Chitinophaga sancti TaxID=1004 RepID=UPI003F7ACA38
MKSVKHKIPVINGRNFRDKYFYPVDTRTDTGKFEIHRREDEGYRCQPMITANRLDFYMVVLVTGGEGIKTFGTKQYYIRKGMLCFISPGMVTNWESVVDEHQGYIMTFDAHILPHLHTYPFFQLDGCPVIQLNAEQQADFHHYFQEIEKEYKAGQLELIKAFLTVVFLKAQQLYTATEQGAGSNAAIRLTAAFTALIDKDFEQKLATYAGLLNVTQNHLNDTVKAVTGKTPGTHIHERMVKEAAQLLVHTELTIAEICYRLNFSDQSYFIRFFKKYTGFTPGQYRSNTKGL